MAPSKNKLSYSQPAPGVAPQMSWPFKPRRTKKILPEEQKEIRRLLAHVKRGHMDIDSIAEGFSVTPKTILRIRDSRKRAKAIPAKKRP